MHTAHVIGNHDSFSLFDGSVFTEIYFINWSLCWNGLGIEVGPWISNIARNLSSHNQKNGFTNEILVKEEEGGIAMKEVNGHVCEFARKINGNSICKLHIKIDI